MPLGLKLTRPGVTFTLNYIGKLQMTSYVEPLTGN